jgi:hypothetical protein
MGTMGFKIIRQQKIEEQNDMSITYPSSGQTTFIGLILDKTANSLAIRT